MKVLLISLVLAGFVFLTLAQTTAKTTSKTTSRTTTRTPSTTKSASTTKLPATTTTQKPSTTKSVSTTKLSATTTTKPSQTTKPGTTKAPTTTTTRPSTTTRRTRAPTTPHQLVDDFSVHIALDYIAIMVFNFMDLPDMPEIHESTDFEELIACITPEQRDEFSRVMEPCKSIADASMIVCFYLSLLMDPTHTRLEQSNMVYVIDYTNLTSIQKTGAIARMQKCYKNETTMTDNLQMFLNILAPETIARATGPVIQNLFNGHQANCQATESKINQVMEDVHVWKAMGCIFEGLMTNGCPQIKPPTY